MLGHRPVAPVAAEYLLDWDAELPVEIQNVRQDRYDERIYNEVSKASKELTNLAGQGPKTWPALLQDIWAQFYKMDPELTLEEEIDPEYRANRPFIDRLRQDPLTEETRITTQLDELSAAVATLAAGAELLNQIEKEPKLRNILLEGGQPGGEGEGEGPTPQEQLEQLPREVRKAVRQAVKQADKETREHQACMRGWGLEPGDLTHVPLEQRLELLKRLRRRNVSNLADLIGRMRNLARAKAQEKLKRERDEIHNITLGNDLGRVLPAELAHLRHPVRKLDFYRRYNERALLQYQLREKEKLGRGPVVCCIDRSGSMSGYPLDWAIAVAVALVGLAARQKRRTRIIFFDTEVQKVIDFEPGEKSLEKLSELASVGAGGGTAYEPALTSALEAIISDGYEHADILFVTDGVCYMDPEYLKRFMEHKRRKKFSVHSILVNATDPTGELGKWSDQVWPITKLTDDLAGEIFGRVV